MECQGCDWRCERVGLGAVRWAGARGLAIVPRRISKYLEGKIKEIIFSMDIKLWNCMASK